jgi:hypothetical protein
MDAAWLRLTDFTRGHDGVITWPQADALAIPYARLQSWRRSGRLTQPGPQVFTVAGTPATWHQRVRVATGSGAGWASHRTAAALWGLDGFERRSVEVVTARGRRRKRRGWRVHESRTLRGVDLAAVDEIPVTSLVRTLLDLPAVAHPNLVAKALDHGCRTHPGLLDAVIGRHRELPLRGRRGAALMTAMLAERAGRSFTDSDFESATRRLVRSVGLPEPVTQHEVRDGEFVAYLDLAWPDIRWYVECDSLAHHFGKRSHEHDRGRRRRLKVLGWDSAEVTYDDVTRRARRTGAELRELYLARAATVAAIGPAAPRGGGHRVRRP